MLIDSHCHLHDREFFTEEEAEKCLERARKAGVEKIICIGTNHEDSLAARDFAARHNGVYWTYGVHPEYADDEQRQYELPRDGAIPGFDVDRSVLHSSTRGYRNHQEARQKSPVAIGEVGLDYQYEGPDRDKQIKLFEQMLQLACDNDLPVSFHVREAFNDFFPVVANFPKVRGVVHSFTDSKKVLKRILNETEFYVGVNGLATYSTLPMPPLERILLETDAPFLAPVPHRGGKNEPAYVAEVAKWLAGRLDTSVTQIADTTTRNAEMLFGILYH